MNPYLETLKDELREECGEDICQADWDEFWDQVRLTDERAVESATGISLLPKEEHEIHIEDDAEFLAMCAQGTRADLSSIVKYAYAAIEEKLK